jgi:serine/threonine-protein kinase greatwall
MTDFQVLKPISKGAFGKVYLCRRHKFPDDLYAVKVLPKAEVKNKTDLMQVTKERRIMAKLHSPFVVDLMFSFQSERNLFLVMEFLPGGDLFSLLQNLGALAEDPARFYIAEILHATNYLHDHGILHRDLKPDNVLIGKDGHIKLTDFGLSERGMLQRKKEIMKPSFRGVSGSVRSFAEVVVGASAKAWDAVGGIFSGIVKGGGKGHSVTSESGPGKTSESETERANVMGRDVVGRDSPDGGLPDEDADPALMTMRLAPALVRETSGESYYSNSSDTSSQGRSKKSTSMMGGRPPSLTVTRARSSMSMINYERATSLQAPSMKSGSLHFHRSRSRSNYASQGRQLSAGTHRALQLDDIPEIEGGGHGGDGGATSDGCRDPSKESRRSSAFNRDSGDFPPLRAKSAESDSSGGEMQRMSSGSFEGNSTSLVSTTSNSGIPILSSSFLPDDFESEREQTQWSSSERRQGGRLRDSIHTLPSDDSVASAAQLKEWQHGNTDATAGGTPDYLAPELLSKDMTHGPPVDLWAIGVILYEFLLGIPPFNAPTAHEIFNNIRNRDIYWPEDEEEAGAAAAAVVEENGNEDDEEETLISPQARDLIDKLLNMDPSKRPTAKQTMKHPFFAGLDFETLRTNQEPPFIPDLEDEFDTSYFDSRQLQDLSLFLDEEEDGTGHETRGMEQLGRVSALNSPALAPAEDPAGEAQELNNLILSRASTPLKSPSQGSANSGSKEKGCSSPEELERPPPSLMLGSFLSPGLVSELQQSQSARSIMRRSSDGSVNQGTMSLTNSPTVLSPDARKSIGMGKPRLHAKRASKTTDDIYIYRKESAPELERLLRVEKLRGDSQRSSLDGMRARKLTGGSVPGTPQSFAGKVQIAAPNGLPSLDLNNELISGFQSPRISSRSSSPMPSQTGMAARKFLARPASSSSVDIDFDDDAGTIGTGAQSHSSSASVDQQPTRSGSVIESKEDYDLSSFSFENLNRLSEMNMEAAARAQDPGKTRNNM